MASVSPARYVPYGFARSHGVLVAAQSGDALEIWVGPSTPPSALGELARVLPFRLVTVSKDEAATIKKQLEEAGATAEIK